MACCIGQLRQPYVASRTHQASRTAESTSSDSPMLLLLVTLHDVHVTERHGLLRRPALTAHCCFSSSPSVMDCWINHLQRSQVASPCHPVSWSAALASSTTRWESNSSMLLLELIKSHGPLVGRVGLISLLHGPLSFCRACKEAHTSIRL